MATKLEKDITRESSITSDDRNIMVTLKDDQTISFKLKGLRTGEVSIPIEELYNQLAGIEGGPKKKSGPVSTYSSEKITKANPMISLYDLRSKSAIANMDTKYKAMFDGIILGLIKEAQR